MPVFEVTVSPNYVGPWGVVDAARELFQNAFDQQTVDPTNELLFSYDHELMILRIGNKRSNLDPSTLILGTTTKAKDDRLIGQFGEGYKLALIVLLRLGKSITIYNNPNVWTPTIKRSEVFNAPLLHVHCVKYRFKSLPEHDLIFEIKGITAAEFQAIQEANRYFHEKTETLSHDYGEILLDPRYKGKLYVSGLFVTELAEARFGYDIKPAHLEIGRDRDLVNHFSIFYRTAQMWAKQNTHAELVNELIADGAKDVSCMEHCVWQLPTETVKYIGGGFYQEHGENAIPVSSEAEAKQARAIHGVLAKVVIVSPALKGIIARCPQFKKTKELGTTNKSPSLLLQAMLDHPDNACYTSTVRAELEALLRLAEYWDWKQPSTI